MTMSLLNGSPDDNNDLNQHTSKQLNFRNNGRSLQKSETPSNNGNSLNNNHDEYKMDVKTNGNEKVAEDDPLTGHRTWGDVERTKEPRWAQKFASTNFFMVIFLLAYVLQGNETVV